MQLASTTNELVVYKSIQFFSSSWSVQRISLEGIGQVHALTSQGSNITVCRTRGDTLESCEM